MFGKGSINDFEEPEVSDKTTIHIVDVPNATNVEISFQNIIDRKTSDSDYFSGTVANRVLGAGPESRLFSVIREEKGFAYGAYSGLPTSSKTKTKFVARTTVRTEVADSAIVEMHNQLKIMRDNPITDEELSNVKSGYFGEFAMSIENPITIANQALSIRSENLPEDFYKTFLSNLNNVSKDDLILDIGPKTIKTINSVIEASKTILWNGPAGYFENPYFAEGSFKIAKKIVEKNKAKTIYSVAGGGDTVAVLNNIGVTDSFNFVSTAGGAFLEYLEGKELPGIKVLN